jgi:histone H3/H4
MAKKTKKKAAKKAPAKKAVKKAPAKKATKKKAAKKGKAKGPKKPLDFIISKSRTKNAAGINVSGEFYGALDEAVREIIAGAEARAVSNGRKTLRPHDL